MSGFSRPKFVKIGALRISPDYIAGYMPIYTEGQRTGMTIYLKDGKTTDFVRVSVDESEIDEVLQNLDKMKL